MKDVNSVFSPLLINYFDAQQTPHLSDSEHIIFLFETEIKAS